jgi:hypothetical protein
MFPTQFPVLTPLSLVELMVRPGVYNCGNPVFAWLSFGKLPENPVVTPTSSRQVITASSINRYLNTVTVNPIPVTPAP